MVLILTGMAPYWLSMVALVLVAGALRLCVMAFMLEKCDTAASSGHETGDGKYRDT